MANPWDDAINNALNKDVSVSKQSEIERKRKASTIAAIIDSVMEIYEYNLPVMFNNNPNIAELLGEVNSEDEDDIFYRDRFRSLRRELRESLINEDYGKNYDKAVKVFSYCLDFYTNTENFRASVEIENILNEMSNGTYDIGQDLDEGKKLSFVADSGTIYYKELIESEYNEHLAFLNSLSESAARLGFTNIEKVMNIKIAEIKSFFSDPNKFKENFEKRGYVESPKEFLQKRLKDDLEEFMKSNYSKEPTRGAFPFGIIQTIEDPSNPEMSELVKGVIKFCYDEILINIENLNIDQDKVKKSQINSFADQLKSYIESWIDVLDTSSLDLLMGTNNQLDSAVSDTKLNWAGTGAIKEEINARIRSLKENFEN